MSTVTREQSSKSRGLSARLFERLSRLSRPEALAALGCVSLLVVLPSVFSGFSTDDHMLRWALSADAREHGMGSPPFDLFRWWEPSRVKQLIDLGTLPWWTHEHSLMAFMRPLSSLSHTLDHALWPNSALAMHVHSVLWFACLLAVTFRVYVEVFGRSWTAGVAAALFALNGAHGVAVGWISNRSALLGAVFGTAALLCHHRWRTGLGRRHAMFAALCTALSLASTESGASMAAYVFAYALLFERGAISQRAMSLVPTFGLLAVWFCLRHAGDYGAYALGGYIDPLRQPLAFITALPERALIVIATQVGGSSADMYAWSPLELQSAQLVGGFVFSAGVLWLAWRGLRTQRSLQFLTVGAGLGALPLVAALPSDRLLAPVALGLMPVLAQAIHDAIQPRREQSGFGRALRRQFGVLLVGIHFGLGPLLLAFNAYFPGWIDRTIAEAEQSAPIDAELAGQTMIVTDLPASVYLNYFPSMRAVEGKPRPKYVYWFSATEAPVRLERIGPRTMRAHGDQGLFERHWVDRAASLPLHEGDRVQLAEVEVHVLRVTEDGRPTVADFTFAKPLHSDAYRWLSFRDGVFVPYVVPPDDPRQYRAARAP